MMGHAFEIVSIGVYTDNAQIATDCLIELEPFIDSVLPQSKEKNRIEVINNNVTEIDNLIRKLIDYTIYFIHLR